MVHAVVTGGKPVVRTEPILMHIGPLQEPAAIGMLDAQKRFTILHLDTKEVQLGEYATRQPYDSLDKQGVARVDQLIRLWVKSAGSTTCCKRRVKGHTTRTASAATSS